MNMMTDRWDVAFANVKKLCGIPANEPVADKVLRDALMACDPAEFRSQVLGPAPTCPECGNEAVPIAYGDAEGWTLYWGCSSDGDCALSGESIREMAWMFGDDFMMAGSDLFYHLDFEVV